MAEYIDREAVIEIAMQYCKDDDGSCSKAETDLREMLDEIEAIPAADVAMVRHGHWTITKDGAAHCSSCKRKMNSYVYGYAYCPLCGAKMDKRSEDDG